MSSVVNVCWRKVVGSTGIAPKARHGHRAVAIKELIVIFGGGNCAIMSGIFVYNTEKNLWFSPAVKGEIPESRASFGMVVDGTRIIICGGMLEYRRNENDVYELDASKWLWKKLDPKPPSYPHPLPIPRLGHSFTLVKRTIYLFGGLAMDYDSYGGENDAIDFPRYLNDFYILELNQNKSVAWAVPITYGATPAARESHSVVAHKGDDGHYRLVMFGGMCGYRRNDLWTLHLGSMTWTEVKLSGLIPIARSLHTASIIESKMYVFGGWVPLDGEERLMGADKSWKVSNDLLCLNLISMEWESVRVNFSKDLPKPRAGHCGAVVYGRIYILSGRDGYRRAWNNQLCCNDFWYLEICRPVKTGRPQLIKSELNTLEINWPSVYSADCYLLQIQEFDTSTNFRTSNSHHNNQTVISPFKDISTQCKNENLVSKQNTCIVVSKSSVVPFPSVNINTTEQCPLPLMSAPLTVPNVKTHVIASNTSSPIIQQMPLPPQQMALATPPKKFSTLQVYSSKTKQNINIRGKVFKFKDNIKNISAQQTIKTINLLSSNLVSVKSENVKGNKFVYNKPGFKLVAVNNNNQLTLTSDNRSERPTTSNTDECLRVEQETAPSSVAKIIQNTNLQGIQNVLVPLKEATKGIAKETTKSTPKKTPKAVTNEIPKIVFVQKERRSVVHLPATNANTNHGIVVQAPKGVEKNVNLISDKINKSRTVTIPIIAPQCPNVDHVNPTQPQTGISTKQSTQTPLGDKQRLPQEPPSTVTSIKIKKCQTTGGIYLSWKQFDPSIKVSEYTVSLQIEADKRKIVYVGAEPWTFIDKQDIDEAIISSAKPLVIFITGRNEHGPGSTVSIRWSSQPPK